MQLCGRVCGSTMGLLGILVAGVARAQGTLEIELLDRGKPIPNTPVAVVELGDLLSQGKPLGTTNSSGIELIDLGKVSFTPGTRVEVWVRTCGGARQVVLVPEGAGSRCDDERVPPADRCGCERLGVFVWGPGRLVVDVGAKTVTHRPTSFRIRHSIIVGGGVGIYSNLEDAVRGQDNLMDATVGTTGTNLSFKYEVQPFRTVPLTLGAGVDCTRFGQFEQVYSGMGAPTRSTLDFGITTFGGSVGFQPVDPEPLGFFAQLDLLMSLNKVDLATFYSGQEDPVTGSRSESGLRMGATIGADLRLGDRTGLRATAGYVRGAGKDADTHLGLGLGFRYNLAGRF